MPQFDGTGPSGRGPGSGLSRGPCRVRIFQKGSLPLMSLVVPAAAFIIEDLRKPGSISRRLISSGYQTVFNAVKTVTGARLLAGRKENDPE